jgi:hypothetical protein
VSLIGDLERWFATSLYPNRVPIAIALVAVTIGLIFVARRRGWFAAARRHPRGAVLALALAAAIGGPTAWYLGSPLFITTSLVEPARTGAPPSPPSGSVVGTPGPSPSAVVAPPSTPILAAARSGEFSGADEFHFGHGTATLSEVEPGVWTVRFEGFSVRNGPDLYVYVSPDAAGYAAGAIELGRLKATEGSFNMDVPAGSDLAAAASIVVWCKQFSVQFAVAPLGG